MEELKRLARKAGARIEESSGFVTLYGVRGISSSGEIVLCDLRKSVTNEHYSAGVIETAIHAIGISTRGKGDGYVYEADGTAVGNQLGEGDEGWRYISLGHTHGLAEGAIELLSRYGRHILGAVAAKERGWLASGEKSVADIAQGIYQSRANIAQVEDRVKGHTVAIIGLGGTGSYVLDLLVRTGVARVVLVDDDDMDLKGIMRSPGAQAREEMARVHAGRIKKVAYYAERYRDMPVKLVPLETKAHRETAETLREEMVSWVFVCIDQVGGSELGRQDEVYEGLQAKNLAFIDCGISLQLDENEISGAVTITRCSAGEGTWKNDIPNAGIRGAEGIYHNIQLPDVNAMAAVLAIMEWKRVSGQYRGDGESGTPRIAKYVVEDGMIRVGGRGRKIL